MVKLDVTKIETCPLCGGVLRHGGLGPGYGLRWYDRVRRVFTIFGFMEGERVSAAYYRTTPAVRCPQCKAVIFAEGT